MIKIVFEALSNYFLLGICLRTVPTKAAFIMYRTGGGGAEDFRGVLNSQIFRAKKGGI